MPTTRRSPILHLLESQGIEFRDFGGGSYAVRAGSAKDELRTLELLGLCDLSGLQKLGLKGHDGEALLTSCGLDVPSDVFASRSLPDGGVILRLGADEFFLEDNISNTASLEVAARIDSHQGKLVRVEHQEATFLLTGRRSLEALAQTCGINFLEATPHRVVFTRVAGVNCGVYPETLREVPAYRLWVDPSYAVYLWETLVEICRSLDGGEIGAGCIYPELLS
jgi:glycine cleavage system aminomethyltransferase T